MPSLIPTIVFFMFSSSPFVSSIKTTPFFTFTKLVAFEKAIADEVHGGGSFSEELWRTLVEKATIYPDRSIHFLFTDGSETTILP